MSAPRTPSPLERRVLMDRLPGVEVPCANCGGRGGYPMGYHADWVPWVACTGCAGTGEEPSGPTRELLRKVGEQ